MPENHDQFIAILDANNISNENSSIGVLKFQIDILQNHFPERLYKLFVVNMSWLPKTIWYAVKPFIKESTKNKINLFGDNTDEILKALSEEIDPELIPVDLGGRNLL